jgi:hypothetical protein
MPSKFSAAEREVGKADATQRRKMPAGWFLSPKDRKYPTHDSSGNLSKSLLEHAEERATQNGHPEIAKQAKALLDKHFPKPTTAKAGEPTKPVKPATEKGGEPTKPAQKPKYMWR